ncbi:MAG: S-layer homology domain-containing protein, partial [Clostridia bacterium]|nr:S-layer homology domain-containing protein [Clostridia bacterium]
GDKTPYPRSLDAALRMHQWVPLINTFKDSSYFTPEFATAFMKYLYQQFEYFPTRKEATGNWRDYEQLAVLYATSAYPELSNSASTKEICIWSWQNAFNKSYMPDGTYIEDTGGYHRSSFAMYRDFKKACVESNTVLPEEFDERIHKAAYYMTLTRGPGPEGYTLQYGDEGGGKSGANLYPEVSDWYNDYEFRFVDSLGKVGIEPAWTSYQFPEGRYTMMRSDWKPNAIYLHTSVRGGGGGGHGHADDNSIILMGNGKRLLVDAGRMTYNSYDASRIYAQSTQGHNTVVINDTSQRGSWTGNEYNIRGTINRWVTNSAYDFLSQTSIAYAEYDHTRNIFFIKDGLFVVSDLMEPHNKNKNNNYKQYWHMLPEANISSDSEKSILSSTYDDGKNLILASADEVDTILEDAFYDTSDGTPVANKAGIFEKNAVGDTTLDTVMYVSNFKDAKVDVEKIEDVSSDDVSSIKITVSENGKTQVYYYMYNHKFNEGDTVTFDSFTTDARVAIVGEDANGNVMTLVLTDGSKIEKNGIEILAVEDGTTDIYAAFTSSKLNIVSSDKNLSSEDVDVISTNNIKSVTFNGQAKEFDIQNGKLTIGSENATETKPEDNNKNDGIVERPNSGGAGGSGGGGGGSTAPVVPDIPSDTSGIPFTDIQSHWAKSYIIDLHSKAIVNGNPDGTYKPDNAISRCEFVAIAVRALSAPKAQYENSYSDVNSDSWYASDVQTALNLGIISEDINFRPGDNITREEMCKILAGCSKYLGIGDADVSPLSFSDADAISEWAVEFVEYAVATGLMNGKDGNIFDPAGKATRAETATVFSRLISKK